MSRGIDHYVFSYNGPGRNLQLTWKSLLQYAFTGPLHHPAKAQLLLFDITLIVVSKLDKHSEPGSLSSTGTLMI